ncbi:LacI family DNA-binding transcriptional regulator [Deinococcus sp. Arct2-2]|uniref:LacI family DNA-binding transcriptional regulator n=1 Tax=Deinococcus sp. Arct2-2 TaxID=2568653 RepID=UPI0010A4EF47|nr:LacI family DNA-binding transcriptional regulator [Deinococcus sp. Arct2-2]THF71161.1 LacI family DNA-binding transcriptional regulator [Deinococcus sp. Arct2-2]
MPSAKTPVPAVPSSESGAQQPTGAAEGKRTPPARRTTLRDVALALGVSVATVSNAYNRPDQLSPDLRERVFEQAAALGYTGPDPLARSLRRGRTQVIGVLYDAPLAYAFADPAASLFLGGVAHALQDVGLSLLLLSGRSEAAPAGDAARSASVDGFISYATAHGSPLLDAALTRNLPTVLVDHPLQSGQAGAAPVPETDYPIIGINDTDGARLAAEHLLALGHTSIGVLGLPLRADGRAGLVTPERERRATNTHILARLQGYRAAVRGSSSSSLPTYEVADNTPEGGQNAAHALLTASPDITALLCMSDVLAQGALAAAAALGLSVPEDLSLIGFDDIPSSAALNLTTVGQPTAQKGEQAGRALLALLAGQTPPNVLLPTTLVVRGSTGSKGGSSE